MAQQGIEEKKPSKIKATAKFLFDVPAWIGVDNIRISTHWLMQLIRKTFKMKQANAHPANFSEAMQRMDVSEEELPAQEKRFLWSSLGFLGLSLLFLFYTVYLWSQSSFLVTTASFVVFALFLIRAYFYSLWRLQIQQKRLDCTFKDWLAWLLRGHL